MICKKCGAQIDDSSTECSFCGAVLKENTAPEETKVIDTDAVNAAVDAAENEPEQTIGMEETEDTEEIFDENERKRQLQLDRIKAEKQQQLDEIERRRNSKKKKQRRNRIIAIAVIILVIAGAGGGIYYIQQNNGSSTEIVVEPTPTAVVTEMPSETVPPAETEAPEETPAVTTSAPAASGNSSTGTGGSTNGTSSGSGGGSAANASSGSKGGSKSNTSSSSKGGSKSNTSSGSSGSSTANSSASAAGSSTGGGAAAHGDYSAVPVNAEGYVFGDSSTRILTEADLAGKTADALRIARNEIYARHGRTFKDSSLQNYFNSRSWYSKNNAYNYSNDAANLNSIEQKNVKFIREYELAHK